MKFKFSLALLLSAIILASSASAATTTTSVVGGVESDSQNGGTVGITSNYATYYQDASAKTGFPVLNTYGQTYLHNLAEYVAVSADVASGKTGSASASFDTKTAQPFTFTDPNVGPTTVSTSLNGAVSVAVTKTSKYGASHADASMFAASGADLATVGTETRLHADDSLTGVGTALAQVSKGEATASANYAGDGIYSKSSVAGDIKLTASQDDDDTMAIDGGTATGLANIGSTSYESSVGVGAGQTDETMTLHANRGVSYTGKSYADGYLNGQEATESQWLNAIISYSAPPTVTAVQTYVTPVVDIESTSKITGSVVAFNIFDIADMNAYLRPVANNRADGSDYAYVDWNALATAVRSTTYDGTAKVEANGFMPIATWISTASTNSAGWQHLALVKGMQGAAWDGKPAVNPGFGVGAWIKNPYNPAQSAQMEATQTADTQPTTGTASATFTMTLKGMSTITGTQKDAVGAFGAVANQYVQIKRTDANYPFVIANTGGNPAVTSYAPKLLDTNAINWLVGDDASLFPGAGKVSPSWMGFSSAGTDAITRQATLTLTQTK